MEGSKAVGVAFVAVVLALGAGLLSLQQSAAVAHTISISSATVATGGQGLVALRALDMTAPGLGAWTIDISYNPAVVTAVACSPQSGSVCNPTYAADKVRVTGASGSGLVGDTTLATVTFRCGASEGSSALDVTVVELADSTPGAPRAIAAAIQEGSVTCSGQVSGQGETIRIGSATAPPGGQDSVDLQAVNIAAPGLGAWTVDITYDPAVVTVAACTAEQGGVCNPAFNSGVVRVTGANISGLQGTISLASIAFRCEREGSSALNVTVQLLADLTVGNPQPITASPQNGSFTCAQPRPTETPGGPAATATPGGFPPAGTGGAGGWEPGGPQSWLIAGLAGAGIAWLIAGLAGMGMAAVTSSRTTRRPAREEPSKAAFTPVLRPLGRRAAEDPQRATVIPASRVAHLPGAGAGSAGSDGDKTGSWFVGAREDLTGTRGARLAGFRALRKRTRGS